MSPWNMNLAAQFEVSAIDHTYCNALSVDSAVSPVTQSNSVSIDFVEDSCDSSGSVEIPIISTINRYSLETSIVDNGGSDVVHFPKFTNTSVVESNTDNSGVDDDKNEDDDDDDDPTYSPSEDESDNGSDIMTDSDPEDDSLLVNAENESVTVNNLTDCEMGGPAAHSAENVTASVEDENLVDDADNINAAAHGVVVAVTNNDGGRKYDKHAFCYFCTKPQAKIVRHMKLKHSKEQMVEELISERDTKRRQLLIAKLRNLGNHRNNCKVTKTGEGVFVVAHRPKEAVTYDKYIPCRYCFGYYAKTSMWKHKCPLAPMTDSGAKVPRVRKGAENLLFSEGNACSVGFAGLMSGMRNDDIGTLAAKDSLILKLGQSLCTKFGGDKEQFNYVRSKMRQAALLLIELRKSSSDKSALTMSDFIHPSRFSEVAAAAKHVAGFKDDSSEYRAPSSALRSGNVIRRLAEVKQAEALERCDQEVAERCVEFLKLCQIKWSNEVSAVALRNITDRKRSGVLFVPLTEDVVKLNTFLNAEATSLAPTVATDVGDFMAMTQVVLAKVILFNRKRQGEVSKVTVDDYKKKGKAQNSDAALSLTDFERSLLNVLERVEIRGKKGRTVPLLLTEEVVSWIDVLVAARNTFVSANNPYLFASNGEHSHLRGSDVLRKFAVDCGAKKPELLTSTRLRKQIASLAQVVSLKENELDSLATFMGHDLRVHTQFYRLPLDVMQICRISKLFLAAEQGNMSEFAGKQLSEIVVHPEAEVELEPSERSDSSGESEPDSTAEQALSDTRQAEVVDSSSGGADMHFEKDVKSIKRRRVTKRRMWTEAEKDAVRMHFATAIMNKKLPGKSEIEAFLSESHLERQWRNVKDHIRNQYFT